VWIVTEIDEMNWFQGYNSCSWSYFFVINLNLFVTNDEVPLTQYSLLVGSQSSYRFLQVKFKSF